MLFAFSLSGEVNTKEINNIDSGFMLINIKYILKKYEAVSISIINIA